MKKVTDLLEKLQSHLPQWSQMSKTDQMITLGWVIVGAIALFVMFYMMRDALIKFWAALKGGHNPVFRDKYFGR